MMDSYNEKNHFDDEPASGNFVRAFDAFRKNSHPSLSFQDPDLCTQANVLTISFLQPRRNPNM